MLQITQVNPNMDWSTLIAAINDNFAALQGLSKTQVFKDSTGVNRVILGQWPDGNWGLIVSKPGSDILRLFNNG